MGERILIGVGIAAGVCLAVLCIADYPPASYINGFQAWLFGGSYFPQLTMLILLFAVLLPCAALASLYRAIVGPADDGRKAAISAKLGKRPFEAAPPASEAPPHAPGPNQGIEKP